MSTYGYYNTYVSWHDNIKTDLKHTGSEGVKQINLARGTSATGDVILSKILNCHMTGGSVTDTVEKRRQNSNLPCEQEPQKSISVNRSNY